MEKTKKKRQGRPSKRDIINQKISQSMSKMTPEVIQKLSEAFAVDATVEDACLWARIGKTTFYRWLEEKPELREEFEYAKLKPVMMAKRTAVARLGDSYTNAMDFLSRKRKNEYSQRTENVNTDMTIDEFAKRFEVGDGTPTKLEKNDDTNSGGKANSGPKGNA